MTTHDEDLYDTIITRISDEGEHDSPTLHLIADGMSLLDEHHEEYVAMQYALLQIDGETFDRTGSRRTAKATDDLGCACTAQRTMTDVSEVHGITMLVCDDCGDPVARHLLCVARQNTAVTMRAKDDAPLNIKTGGEVKESTVRGALAKMKKGSQMVKVTLDKPSGSLFAADALTAHLEG